MSSTVTRTFVLTVTGLGGLLYGIDVGVIAAALPYVSRSNDLTVTQSSLIVAAVLGGSMFSSVAAGLAADRFGRKAMMIVSAALFLASVVAIVSSQGFAVLFAGRVLQGLSGGVIAVVVPLYLAECMDAGYRGRGSAIFQFMLTLGIVLAAAIGFFYTRIAERNILAAHGNSLVIAQAEVHAWRGMFLAVAYPGILFLVGCLFLKESPRWLAGKALLSRSRVKTEVMTTSQDLDSPIESDARNRANERIAVRDLFQRKYVLPFGLACIVLACNQATGINSILGYLVVLLKQGGMTSTSATQADFFIKLLNCIVTVIAAILVDRKGRKFLLSLGTAGACVALALTALTFRAAERQREDVRLRVTSAARQNAVNLPVASLRNGASVISVLYGYGNSGDHTITASSTDPIPSIVISPEKGSGQLVIKAAYAGPSPTQAAGWWLTSLLALFIASFAIGPGVVVWLALSELMPTRIRSTGMGIALLINQGTSTAVAGLFLPVTSRYGYSTIFAIWAAFTAVYFLIAMFQMPETKGKTLEEIEACFIRTQEVRAA